MDALRVRNLCKSFRPGFASPRTQVLKGLSFSAPEGKITGFVGLNGAGKTTTLKCILGFIEADDGEVEILGMNSQSNLQAQSLEKVGFVSERQSLPDFATPIQFLQHQWRISSSKSEVLTGFKARAEALLQQVGLSENQNRKMRSFSKGMLQRVAIAGSLLRAPKLLILDEPFSGLDVEGRFLVQDILSGLRSAGASVFFSTHSLADVLTLCDHLVMIRAGELIFEGSVFDFTGSETAQLRTHIEHHRAIELRMKSLLEGLSS
jgi:ABC-2 type transport system ATP-binding protein